MADRSKPEFDWLYGGRSGRPAQPTPPATDRTRAIPVQQRPDAAAQDGTRVMPSQPRTSTRPPAAPPTPPARPVAPPPSGSGNGPRRRGLSARTIRRVVYVLLVAWIAYLVIVPFFAWKSVDKVEFAPTGDRPAEQPGTTYLLVGTDSRAGLSEEQRKKLATGDDVGSRTDTIMLLHTGDGPNLLMSIPRDSLVSIPGHGDGDKINAAFAWGGAQLLAQTIENETGIRVDEYAEIGMGGVVSIVNAVGGITICPEFDMDDPLAGIDIKAGCQHANGKKALGYARSRHSDPQYGDITRAKHQREVVAAVGHKAASPWSVINPVRYWNLAHAAPKSFAFGKGASPVRAAMWALAMTHTTGSKGMTCGVPISDLAVHWDAERSQKLFDYIKTDRTQDVPASLCTPTGLPKSATG